MSRWISSIVRLSRVSRSGQSARKLLTSTPFFKLAMEPFFEMGAFGIVRGARAGGLRGEERAGPGDALGERSCAATKDATENIESEALCLLERLSDWRAFSFRPKTGGETLRSFRELDGSPHAFVAGGLPLPFEVDRAAFPFTAALATGFFGTIWVSTDNGHTHL